MKKLIFEKIENEIEKNEKTSRGLILAKRTFKGKENAFLRKMLKQKAAKLLEENVRLASAIEQYGKSVESEAIEYVDQFIGQHLKKQQQEEIVVKLREIFGTTRPSFKTKRKGLSEWLKKLGYSYDYATPDLNLNFKSQWDICIIEGR